MENKSTEGLASLCELASILSKEEIGEILSTIIERHPYTVKDLAELMEVSMSAASRYVHGSLKPSSETLCKLVTRLDPAARSTFRVKVLYSIWARFREALASATTAEVEPLLEDIADTVSMILARLHRTRGDIL
jgi:transcriptional regulator with XRE-family HTH domain